VDSQPFNLESWFLHEETVARLVGVDAALAIENRVGQLPPHPQQNMRRFLLETDLARALIALKVPSLADLYIHSSLEVGKLVWIEQAFYFKRAPKNENDGSARAQFHGKFNVDNSITVSGDFNPTRLVSQTAKSELSGHSRQFIVGYIKDLLPERVVLRPLFIGRRFTPGPLPGGEWFSDQARVRLGDIDQFSDIDITTRVDTSDLKQLKSVPEDQVKKWLAEIIGEPVLPNDWGGEQFDLWSTMLTVNGHRVRSAWLLKGPAKFHPMHIGDLGKNGDQIDRLFATAADLVVVQHCHSIKAPVENMLKIYATNPIHLKKYMVIDGYDTLRILQQKGYLPVAHAQSD